MTKSTLVIFYLTLFSISVWIVFDIYSNFEETTIQQEIQNISRPISGEIDTEVINLLEKRVNNE